MHPVRFFILMGVAGCGKSSYGARLADQLQATYLDGDDFHPPENIAKIRQAVKKPMLITEYGVGVDPRLHTLNPMRFDYSH